MFCFFVPAQLPQKSPKIQDFPRLMAQFPRWLASLKVSQLSALSFYDDDDAEEDQKKTYTDSVLFWVSIISGEQRHKKCQQTRDGNTDGIRKSLCVFCFFENKFVQTSLV